MRKAMGWGLFAVGTVALGLWGRADHADRMQTSVSQAAMQAVAGSVHGVQAVVSGRDITLTGMADTAAERDALVAAANAVPGRRTVNAPDLAVLPVASPYVTELSKAEGGAISASGHAPSEALRAGLAPHLGGAEGGLTLASGATGDWGDKVQAGLRGLGPMIEGTARVEDDRLTLIGTVLGPEEHIEMLYALGDYADTADLEGVDLLDDGAPVAWQFDWSALSGAKLTGKLPRNMTPDAVQSALGVASLDADDTMQARIGEDADLGLWARVKAALPGVETLRLRSMPDETSALAGLAKGVDLDAARASLAGALPAGFDLSVETAEPGAEDGAERTNAATGTRERLSGGYWLPVPSFAPSVETCTTEAQAVLDSATINFVSGSAELDSDALSVLNAIGAIVRECTTTGGLKAEIGGHTDSSGPSEGNRRLSQLRAAAVRAALIERGAAREALVSRGYGDTMPIADNETDEGKAKNRRTTIIWTE